MVETIRLANLVLNSILPQISRGRFYGVMGQVWKRERRGSGFISSSTMDLGNSNLSLGLCQVGLTHLDILKRFPVL